MQQQTAVCNCTKSRCVKKYCECFKMNISCGSLCRCMECENKNNINNINNDENININILNNDNNLNNFEEENQNQNINQIDYQMNLEKIKYLCQSYNINAFGVFIRNKKLIIEARFVDLNSEIINLNKTPKLTNKKRNRNKNNENSNLKTCPTTNSPFRNKRRGHSQVNTNIKNKKLIMN